MPDLPILIPAAQREAEGYSLVPLNLLIEERLWPAEDEDGFLEIEGDVRRWKPAERPVRIDQITQIDGHDLRTEERDSETGIWRPRRQPMVARSAQTANQEKHSVRRPGHPLRSLRPSEYSRPALQKCLGQKKTDFLTAINSLQTALKKRKGSGMKEAAAKVIAAANDEALSDRLVIETWVKQLSRNDSYVQILATGYLGQILFPGRVIFWTTATQIPQLGPGLFFPDLKTAVAAAALLDGVLRVCLKCSSIFSAVREDQVCCSLRCSNAFRQFQFQAKQPKRKTGGR